MRSARRGNYLTPTLSGSKHPSVLRPERLLHELVIFLGVRCYIAGMKTTCYTGRVILIIRRFVRAMQYTMQKPNNIVLR